MKESRESPLEDTAILARLDRDAKNLETMLSPFPNDLIKVFDPMADPQRTSKPPKGSQSSEEQKLDNMRGAMCSEMTTFYKSRSWNDLCGNRILSKKFSFGQATTGAEDIVPACGLEAALSCAQGMGAAAQGPGGTSDTAEALQTCDMTAWRTACADGASNFNANSKDPGFNQRLYGRVPIDCYCACYNQCSMGQSTVLGAQQHPAGPTCTLGHLSAGKCKVPS